MKIAAHMVRAQLRRILASDGFVRFRGMHRFLEFIVEETLVGRADERALGLGEEARHASIANLKRRLQ